jgi:basic membrane protein A
MAGGQKMKKIFAILLALAMMVCLFTGCSNVVTGEDDGATTQETNDSNSTEDSSDTNDAEVAPYGFDETMELAESGIVSTAPADVELTGDISTIKVGFILLGDENEGYTAAHINGIKAAAENLGMDDSQILWKYSIAEDQTCYDAAEELVDEGCGYIFSNSYGHQTYMQQAAEANPDVTFVAMTGDLAASSGLENYCNAFTDVYESRYISGVVAGMKIAELVEDGTITDANIDENGNVKIGYVGAYPYAEVVSGYTAFYLGAKSVYEKISMEVVYTNTWFDITAEAEAANTLISHGCVIIGQHADSTGAPSAVQAAYEDGALAYSVGYNIDMLEVAPDTALTSSTNNWEAYYEFAFRTAANGDKIPTNWAAGYTADAVAITALGPACAEGTQERVDEAIAGIKDGTLHVFDTSTFTVEGQTVTYAYATDTDGDFVYDSNNVVADGFFHESYIQSAPAFSLRIDGITEIGD